MCSGVAKIPCAWVCLCVYSALLSNVSLISCLGGERGNTCSFMCRENDSATINVSLCDIEDLGSAEECDIWLYWLELIVIQAGRSHAAILRTHTHTHTHTLTLAVQDPLCECVCHYHTSGSHWGPPTPENACRTTIYRQDHLEMPFVQWRRCESCSVRLSWCYPHARDSSEEVLATWWHEQLFMGEG